MTEVLKGGGGYIFDMLEETNAPDWFLEPISMELGSDVKRAKL